MPTARKVRRTLLQETLARLKRVFVDEHLTYDLKEVEDILLSICGAVVVQERRIAHNELVVVSKFENVPRYYLDVMFLLDDSNNKVKCVNGILRELL